MSNFEPALRDTNENMIELLNVNKENSIYSSTVSCEIEEKKLNLNFGIEKSDFSRLKRILEFQPFQNGGFGKYRYFFALSYRNHSEKDNLCFTSVRVEKLKTHKEFEFELSKKYVSNILWFNKIEFSKDVAHLIIE